MATKIAEPAATPTSLTPAQTRAEATRIRRELNRARGERDDS